MNEDTRPPSDPTIPMPGSSSGDSGDGSRLPSGTVLAGRYRLEGRLGRGGMGEVYRAHDLKLDQTVALKFLPPGVGDDGAMLARLHREVRVAREVAHPNVVRVYDIAEGDGHTFLSMEYVDGEDLGSLLRRIGRFPIEKGVQIARQLCVGLAAAHERGVLHRDLKPANIMIDGKGRVRITDFGLAALFEDMAGEKAGAGTPAYMAPEQLAGNEITLRSDIYSLGLVLYELFTGKRAFPGDTMAELRKSRAESTPRTPSELVGELDPLIERVILRCLEAQPRDRPASALVVAMALPGGDPLAAALAAGETPSPEMVAGARVHGGLSQRWRVGLLVAVVIGVLTGTVASDLISPFHDIPLDRPTAFLADDARRHLESFGIPAYPFEVHGFAFDGEALEYFDEEGPDHFAEEDTTGWREELADGSPPLVRFWLRQSRRPLIAERPGGTVGMRDPPMRAGMTTIALDGEGKLVELVHLPGRMDSAAAAPRESLDVSSLMFAAAGLDPRNLETRPDSLPPPIPFTEALVHEGVYPGPANLEMHVHEILRDGHPVVFSIQPPWGTGVYSSLSTGDMSIEQSWLRVLLLSVLLIVLGFFLVMGLLVRRNLRQGRVDRKGASRLAFVYFGVQFGAFILGADHTLHVNEELRLLREALAVHILGAIVAYGFYVLVEPYVRRQWPDALISWSRLLAGRWRDPVVGRDILIGTAAAAWIYALLLLSMVRAGPDWWADNLDAAGLLSTRRWLAGMLEGITSDGLMVVLTVFLILFILRAVFRRQVIVYWVVFALLGLIWVLMLLGSRGDAIPFGMVLVMIGLFAFIVRRYGLLAAIVMSVAGEILGYIPTTLNLGAWHAPSSSFMLIAAVALAVYGFYASGRPAERDSAVSSLG